MKIRINSITSVGALALLSIILCSFRCVAQNYSVGTFGIPGVEATGFSIDGSLYNITVGQTFLIPNNNALVTDISVPVVGAGLFQMGVAAWNGSQPTGPLLYISDPLYNTEGVFQTFTVMPSDLMLNQNQEYILFLTANNFVNSNLLYSAGVGDAFP